MRILWALLLAGAAFGAERPNILWIDVDGLSPEIGADGAPYAVTPNLDRLASESVLYTRAFSNAAASEPARSTRMTGMYPASIGTQHTRSAVRPPAFVRGLSEILREGGYATATASFADWKTAVGRPRGDQPFFTVVHIAQKDSNEALEPEQRHDPSGAVVPPYYPDTPEVRRSLARYADRITLADRRAGEVLATLEAAGLAEQTIVFLFGDPGSGLPRSDGFLFESSTHTPLLIRFPEKFADLAPASPGGKISRLVAFIDFAPTALSLAGAEIPKPFQGQAFLGAAAGFPPQFVFGYRDRVDERYELIRSVRDGRFKYIRNYFPHRAWFREQTRLSMSTHPVLSIWRKLARAGELTEAAEVYMAAKKPREQVFDLRQDPDEVHNLAADPRYAGVLDKLRKAHRKRLFQIRDTGFLPEEEAHLRFNGRLWDAARDEQQYPLQRILQTADWVGQGAEKIDAQIERLSDSDPTVRFWAATGLIAQSERAAAAARPALRRALTDQSVAVRTAAAEALCRTGECERALEVLLENLRHPQEHAALRAANVLDHLDEKARPALAAMQSFAARTAALQGREFFRQAPLTHWVLRTALRELEQAAGPAPAPKAR